ncbi:MAG: hypothetical protein EOP02_28100, partial [Proteobacteria bacterium]
MAFAAAAYGADESCNAALNGKRLTLVVPNAAGGGYDTYARALVPSLGAATKANIRVVNMPAAGGLAALKRVAESKGDELVVLLDGASDVISQQGWPTGASNWLDLLRPMGIVISEPETWVVRNDLDLRNATTIVGAVTSFDTNVLPMILTSYVLGTNMRLVAGYDGSSAYQGALMRSEADLFTVSLTTALRAVASGDLQVGMTITDGPASSAPEAPYFAGEGGMVWQRTVNLPPNERQERMRLAETLAKAVGNIRTLFAPASLPANAADCLAESISTALASDSFAAEANAQKRPIQPQSTAA